MVKNPPANAGDERDACSITGSGRSPGEGMATHSSILAWRMPMDREACQATGHRGAKSRVWMKQFSTALHVVIVWGGKDC